MIDAKQVGEGSEDLLLSNDSGRIRLDGDEVGALLYFLAADETYRDWMGDALGWER